MYSFLHKQKIHDKMNLNFPQCLQLCLSLQCHSFTFIFMHCVHRTRFSWICPAAKMRIILSALSSGFKLFCKAVLFFIKKNLQYFPVCQHVLQVNVGPKREMWKSFLSVTLDRSDIEHTVVNWHIVFCKPIASTLDVWRWGDINLTLRKWGQMARDEIIKKAVPLLFQHPKSVFFHKFRPTLTF